VRLNVNLDDKLYHEFKAACEAEDLSISHVIRVQIKGWTKRRQKVQKRKRKRRK